MKLDRCKVIIDLKAVNEKLDKIIEKAASEARREGREIKRIEIAEPCPYADQCQNFPFECVGVLRRGREFKEERRENGND